MSVLTGLIDILRWIIAVPLLLISLYFIYTNLKFLFQNIQVGFNAGPAAFTLFGGLAGCLGIIIVPYMDIGDRLIYLWVPLVLDLGSIPFYASMIILAIWQHINKDI